MEGLEMEEFDPIVEEGADFGALVLSKLGSSEDPDHQHLCAVLGAMAQELRDNNLSMSPVAYFCSTVSSLDRLSSEPSISPNTRDHAVDSLVTILSMVIPKVPRGVLKKKKQSLLELVERVLRSKDMLPAARASSQLSSAAPPTINYTSDYIPPSLKHHLTTHMKRVLISTILLSRLPNPFLRIPISISIASQISRFHTNQLPITPNPFKGARDFSTPIEFDHATVCETLASFNNDYRRALDFFNWVESNCGFHHTTETYNKMIDILGKFFEFDKSWELIRTMSRNRLSMPNYATFRLMFKRYALAHMVKEALDTYYGLDEFNLKDETSFCNLIDALCEYKHVLEAEEFCRKECVYVGCKTKMYNMILRGWLKLGWWAKCREFWEEMDRMEIRKDLVSYSIYMDIQCKCKKPWKAVKLYKEMKRRGIRLDVVAYNTVVHAIGLSEGVDFSIRLCNEMYEVGCKPNVVTYNTIIKLLSENGRTKEAYEILHQMSKKGCEPNAITYTCLFRSLVRPKEILRLFDTMIESGVQPSLDTYVMLMRKFGRWGFLRPLFMVWKKMEELNCSPDAAAYNALIDALVQKGMLDMARKYDEEMLAKGLSAKPRKELAESQIDTHSGDVNLL